MDLLENYLNNQIDERIPGFFSSSIKKGYHLFDDLLDREPELQLVEARNAYGNLRHVYIDIVLKHDAKKTDIDLSLSTNEVSKKGFTYLTIAHKNSIITVNKTNHIEGLPQKAVNRTERSYMNQNIPTAQLSLFDSLKQNKKTTNNDNKIYLMVTYGGRNYKLEYIQLGIPKPGATSWLYVKDITNALSVVSPATSSEEREINLEFNKEVKKMLQREKENHGGKI